METEIIDKLFLELSQVTKAKTARELKLETELEKATDLLKDLAQECGVEQDDPRIRYVTVQIPRVVWEALKKHIPADTEE